MELRKGWVFGFAAALRLLLFLAFPSLPDVLTNRVEVSTPVTSYKRLLEGVFLYTHDISPYDGGVFHQAPLLLTVFSAIDPFAYPLAVNILYIVCDLVSAQALVSIAETGVAYSARLYRSPRTERYSSLAIAAGFLLNPLTIATCLARSTSAFTTTLVLQSLASAAKGKSLSAVLALGCASHLSLHPILLAPAVLLLSYDQQLLLQADRKASPLSAYMITHATSLVGVIGALLYLSYVLTGSWQFLQSTYGVMLLLPDLTPNVGLWWYFFIEMFDSFREFFLGVFWLHMISYCPGFSIRFRNQPLFAAVALTGIIAIFQPYPSVADSALFLGLLPLYRHVFPLMRYSFITSAALMYSTLLGPVFYHLWIYAGSGNANFFYAITLIWCLGLTILVADILYAVLRDEVEQERPELKGQEIRQV